MLQELQLGRVIGPFSLHSPPFECVKICPLNIVPKGEKKWRLIQDLSSPQKHSVNDGILQMPTQWQLIDDALQLIHDAGRGCHLVKMDVKSAYRQLPVHPNDWHLFGFICEDLLFIDTYLPFGCRRQAVSGSDMLKQHSGSCLTTTGYIAVLDGSTTSCSFSMLKAVKSKL